MNDQILLRVRGDVEHAAEFTFEDLSGFEDADQILDVSRYDPERAGDAIALQGLVRRVGVREDVRYIGLHSSHDDFHASIPLGPIRDKAFLIYRVEGAPLELSKGGPLRFYIPDHAACHTDEIDECANVKFVDEIEFTREKGFDNRPEDDESHEELHRKAEEG